MENQNQTPCSCGLTGKCECGETCACGTICQKCGRKCCFCSTGACSKKNVCFTLILLIIIAVLLGTAALYFYFQSKNSNDNYLPPEININASDDYEIPGEEDATENPIIEEEGEEEILDEEPLPLNDAPAAIFYNNNDYGFALTFPSSWTGYIATERTLSWGAPVGDSNSLDFGFTAQDSIFNISIFTLGQWTDLQSMEGPLPGYLGENSQYVFAYDTAQFAANADMSTRRTEVAGIVGTFRTLP
ncbi:MAG TPA: hypothetical protein PL066_01800 [bacterium]|nr:hypothetical protein [bacterium]